jgi:hypothetical protein
MDGQSCGQIALVGSQQTCSSRSPPCAELLERSPWRERGGGGHPGAGGHLGGGHLCTCHPRPAIEFPHYGSRMCSAAACFTDAGSSLAQQPHPLVSSASESNPGATPQAGFDLVTTGMRACAERAAELAQRTRRNVTSTDEASPRSSASDRSSELRTCFLLMGPCRSPPGPH